MKIGIIGLGYVGSAIYNSIIDKSSVVIFDKYLPKINCMQNELDMVDCDVIFLCLPTPFDNEKGIDTSSFDNILLNLFLKFNGLLVIKSTLHPEFLKKIVHLDTFRYVVNPEFLTEHNHYEDFKNQSDILIGGRIDYCYELVEIYKKYFDIKKPNFTFCSIEEAMTFKYLRNIKLAYDILFCNFIEETTQNFRKYQNLFKKFPVKPQHEITIKADGNPGFGGSCLPKDVKAYNFIFEDTLTDFIIKYNNELQGIKE